MRRAGAATVMEGAFSISRTKWLWGNFSFGIEMPHITNSKGMLCRMLLILLLAQGWSGMAMAAYDC
jgi:hypothetical protein